jgi:hypothetical protein
MVVLLQLAHESVSFVAPLRDWLKLSSSSLQNESRLSSARTTLQPSFQHFSNCSITNTPGVRHNTSDTGSWLANQWIPPQGWKLYSAAEIRHYFSKKSILLVGDSQCRRFLATLWPVLSRINETDIPTAQLDNVLQLNVNKNWGPVHGTMEPCERWHSEEHIIWGKRYNQSLCRKRSQNKEWYDYLDFKCHIQLQEFFDLDLKYNRVATKLYDVIIIMMGVWDFGGHKARQHCERKGFGRSFPKNALRMLRRALRAASHINTTLVWRTTGYHQWGEHTAIFQQANAEIRNFIQSQKNMVLMDLEPAIAARSFGQTRIVGDNGYHYGLEARLMMIQLLMNCLKEHEIRRRNT